MIENIAVSVKIVALIVYLILFLLVIKSKVEAKLKRLFFLYIFGLLIWHFSSLMIHFSNTKERALFWYKLLGSGVALQSIIFLPFSQVFLKIKRQKFLTYISYITTLVVSIAPFILKMYSDVYIGMGGYYIPVFTNLFYSSGIIGYLFWGFGVFNFIRYYFLEKSKLQKNRIKYILTGALIVVIGSTSNFTVLQSYPVDILCNLINAILIAHAVRKYHLLELRIALKKSLLIFLVVLSITFLFLIDNYLFNLIPGFSQEQSTVYSGIVSAILILVFILIFQIEKINNFVQNIIHPEQKDYQRILENYSKKIASLLDIEELKQSFFNIVKDTFDTKYLIFMIYNPEKKKFIPNLVINEKSDKCNLECIDGGSPLVNLMLEHQRPILIDELPLNPIYSNIASKVLDALKKSCVEVVVPIILTNSLYGFLLLGEKKSKRNYTVQDISFLSTLSHTTATGISNSKSYHELQSRLSEQMLLFLLSENFSKTEELEFLIKRACHIFVNFLNLDWATIGLLLEGFEDRIITNGNIIEKEISLIKSIYQKIKQKPVLASDSLFDDFLFKSDNLFKIDLEKNIYEKENSFLFIPLLHDKKPIGFLLLKFNDLEQRSRFIKGKYSLLKSIQTVISQGITLHSTFLELQAIKNRNEIILEGVGKAGNIIFITDMHGTIKRVNSTSNTLLGYENSEIVGHNILDFLIFEKNNKPYEIDNIINQYQSNSETYTASLMKKNGSTMPVILSIIEVKNEEVGNKTYLFITKDITDIRVAEENVKKSEEKYIRLFNEIDEVIIIIDPNGIIRDINPAGVDLLGFLNKKNLIGQNIRNVIDIEESEFDEIFNEVLEKGHVKNRELSIERNGKLKNMIININMAYDVNGKPFEASVVIHDITELKLLERQFLQAQKMESIGTLAGGIAHDFNNILTAILGYTSIMKSKLEENNPYNEYLSVIESSAKRAAGLTQKLLAFARAGKYKENVIDINRLVKETVALLRETIEKNISIEIELTSDIPKVRGDENQIHQVIMNLCVNARDAMPDGGRLIIKTGLRELDENYVKKHMGAKTGKYVFVSIEDTGIGIEKENIKRIFDPFFTTKEKGKGTGLGLSVVYGIVKNHNGYIDVQSNVGLGTVFAVFLPPTKDSVDMKEKVVRSLSRGSGETILVIDDEDYVRNLLKDILENNGYRVMLAGNGIEGINTYKKYSNEIDLVILDMIMPKMDGEETFNMLKKIDPKIKVVLSTGYINDKRMQTILQTGIAGVVKKPFNMKDLLNTINNAIQS